MWPRYSGAGITVPAMTGNRGETVQGERVRELAGLGAYQDLPRLRRLKFSDGKPNAHFTGTGERMSYFENVWISGSKPGPLATVAGFGPGTRPGGRMTGFRQVPAEHGPSCPYHRARRGRSP